MSAAPHQIACRVCGERANQCFTKLLLHRHSVAYYDCANCGYVQTEEPYWLDEAYASPINANDTGVLARCATNTRRTLAVLLSMGSLRGKVIDHAGGHGILTRMLRDVGVDALWSDKYCENIFARGFEADLSRGADLLTAFEVLEHLPRPVAEIEMLFARASTLLMSTDLIESEGPLDRNWWYLIPDEGQHIGFFRVRTLRHIAKMLGCHLATDGKKVHVFSIKPIAASLKVWMALRHSLPLLVRLRLGTRLWSDFLDLQARRSKL